MTKTQAIKNRIERTRKAQRRSVSWLSEVSGIADKTLRRRLSSPEQFNLAELSAIARVLGVSLESFFTDDEAVVAVETLEDLKDAA